MSETVSILVVGNEVLSGQVVDENGPFLCRTLHDLGCPVKRIATVGDDTTEIAQAIAFLEGGPILVTGGVGPTHDDVTVLGVAQALSRPVERHPMLEAMLREHFQDRITEAHLKMADMVEGTELIFDGGLKWPVCMVREVYLFPGVPTLLRPKFQAIMNRFRREPFAVRKLRGRLDEGALAIPLSAVAQEFHDIAIGSYPQVDPWGEVLIIFESRDEDRLEAAVERLQSRLEALRLGALERE